MSEAATSREDSIRFLDEAPPELTESRLRRLGEGVGKVVYASTNWVVKRERSPKEVIAIVVLWHWLRKLQSFLPGWIAKRLTGPGRQIRALRVFVQAAIALFPNRLWYTSHIRKVWRTYYSRDRRGERLSRQYLTGTDLVPKRIAFPPVRVSISGWPGSLVVSEAAERVETTLYAKLESLADAGEYDQMQTWLDKFLELRQNGWQRGLFSTDAHLKNFGVCGSRLVLLDTGGLTDRWSEIQSKLSVEDVVSEPHIQLGLGKMLGARPDIAFRFNSKWRAVVNPERVREKMAEAGAKLT